MFIRVKTLLLSVGICLLWVGLDEVQSWADEPAISIQLQAPLENDKNPHAAAFKSRDADANGMLTLEEHLKAGGRDAKVLQREFNVFDADGDRQLTLNEFLTIPAGQPEDQRGVIADPVVQLAERRWLEFRDKWKLWDADQDGFLSRDEFSTAKVASLVSGLESTTFPDWDQDRDGKLSRADAAQSLSMAFGVRTPRGEPLRNGAGRVVDWLTFRRLKVGVNGLIEKADYFEALGAIENKDDWLKSIDKNGDNRFDYAEFATGNHRTDPVSTFLNLDTDVNGRLNRKELESLPDGWRQMADFAFQGFDEDRDGAISLREYQLMPHCNLLAGWMEAKDANNDGKLTLQEFLSVLSHVTTKIVKADDGQLATQQIAVPPDLFLAALTAEYFRRLDVDGDQRLSLDEFQFTTTHRRPNEIFARLKDGRTVTVSIPGYPNIYSPEISPDGKWVAVDGWKNGQSNGMAHLFLVSLETDEVRDLGIGCIPHWSPDGKKIGFSRYGEGVFIRPVEGDADKDQSIDGPGWSIHFAPDGRHVAFVTNGSNFTILELETGRRHTVFPEGQSPFRYIEHNYTWTADSRRLCFKGHRANGNIELGIVSTAEGAPNLKIRCDAKDIQSDLACHPDGKRLMFPRTLPGAKHSQIHEIELDGDKPSVPCAVQRKDWHNIGISWTPDGKAFAYMTSR